MSITSLNSLISLKSEAAISLPNRFRQAASLTRQLDNFFAFTILLHLIVNDSLNKAYDTFSMYCFFLPLRMLCHDKVYTFDIIDIALVTIPAQLLYFYRFLIIVQIHKEGSL